MVTGTGAILPAQHWATFLVEGTSTVLRNCCPSGMSADVFSNLREVVVIPNEKWGGSGLLGCGVG